MAVEQTPHQRAAVKIEMEAAHTYAQLEDKVPLDLRPMIEDAFKRLGATSRTIMDATSAWELAGKVNKLKDKCRKQDALLEEERRLRATLQACIPKKVDPAREKKKKHQLDGLVQVKP
jgi:tRNA U55 pseudouridine synthase TruB